MVKKKLSQKERLVAVFVYLISLVLFSKIVFPFEGFIPPFIQEQMWFWTAFEVFIFTQLLDQPFYSSPVNALLNSLGSIITILGIIYGGNQTLIPEIALMWNIALFASLIVFGTAIIAIFLRGMKSEVLSLISRILTFCLRFFGTPRFVFSSIYLITVLSFHINNSMHTFLLLVIWGVVVFVQPIENLIPLISTIIPEFLTTFSNKKYGELIARHEPRAVTIKVLQGKPPQKNTFLLISLGAEGYQLVTTINSYRLSGEIWCRAIILAGFEKVTSDKIFGISSKIDTVFRCDLSKLSDDLREKLENHSWHTKSNFFLGLVIERSNVNTIRVELLRDEFSLEEGQLLEVLIGDKNVLYQIIDGMTQSEALEKSNEFGFLEIKARKLGMWDEKQSLQQVPWLPEIYSPVFIRRPVKSAFNHKFVGYIPQTDYGIEVDCNALVTHNTAILGVLGTGKTRLALELIGRMLNDGISVWVIDITGRYREHLKAHLDPASQISDDEEIRNYIKDHETDVFDNKYIGGNHEKFREISGKQIEKFLKAETSQIRVFEPYDFRVTEQVTNSRNTKINNEWVTVAGHGSLSPAQITRIITEEFLSCLQKEGVSETGQVCLVYEEAHSLVPEWNVASGDGDGRATNATAKAILQGRKYGLGCLLITQRTAHVTKSILNQCHTIFALQIFDKTGMDFLSNYIGEDYTNLLSTLQSQHCVGYGKALNSGTPLLVGLNQHDQSNNIAKKFIHNNQASPIDELSE